MTAEEIRELDEGFNHEAECRRRMNNLRRKWVREHVASAALIAFVIGAFVFAWWWNRTRPLRDAAIYNDGVAAAEAGAAAVGGWEAWINAEVAKVGKEVR